MILCSVIKCVVLSTNLMQNKQSQLRHSRFLAIIYLTFSLAVVKFKIALIGRVITFFGLVLRHSIVRTQSGVPDMLTTESKFIKREACAWCNLFRGCDQNITRNSHQELNYSRTIGLCNLYDIRDMVCERKDPRKAQVPLREPVY